MIIEKLELNNFRNYGELHLSFDPGIHIFYGDNAQGKSNLLEAICLTASLHSYRGAKDREMIRFGQEEGHIKVFFSRSSITHRADIHLKKSGNKGVALDGVPIRKVRDYLGCLNCVLFSPEDLQIVKNGPQERRRFLNEELCILDPVYLNAFTQYKKVLDQRNQLLKDIFFEPSLKDTLEMWDSQLVKYGKEIIQRRSSFIDKLREITGKIHLSLSGEREKVSIYYEPNVAAEDFEKQLKEARERDFRAKTTTVGPHRDDFSFMIMDLSKGQEKENVIDARIYGSQGQQRTSALSLKMAEIEIVKEVTKETPILLLDDVLSELDRNRQNFLLNSLNQVQTFITCTGLDDFVDHQDKINSIYHVVNGEISNGE